MYYIKTSVFNIINPGNDIDIKPSIQYAVNDATDGDTIIIPAGKFIFNGVINISKFISIKGAGKGKTILYRSKETPDSVLEGWQSFFNYNTNSRVSSGIIVRDFTCKSKDPSRILNDGLSMAKDKAIAFNKCVDFIVTGCGFENFGLSPINVLHHDDLSRGLIYGNTFKDNYKGPDAQGLGYGVAVFGENIQWTPAPEFGTENFIFIEDNEFDGHRHAVTAGGCGRYVFRNNNIKRNLIAQAIDAHEAREVTGLNYFSTRAFEIYNNTITNTTFKDGTPIVPGKNAQDLSNNAILIRGGEGVIYNNTINGYRFGVGIINFEKTGPQSYPIPYQIGCESGMNFGLNHTGTDGTNAEGDLFVWDNNFTPYVDPAHSSLAFNNFQPDYFKEKRDYHLVKKPGYTPYTYPHPKTNG